MTDDKAIIRALAEAAEDYRRFVESVNRATEKEIDAVLHPRLPSPPHKETET